MVEERMGLPTKEDIAAPLIDSIVREIECPREKIHIQSNETHIVVWFGCDTYLDEKDMGRIMGLHANDYPFPFQIFVRSRLGILCVEYWIPMD